MCFTVYSRVGEQGLLTLFSPVGLNSSGVYTCVVRVFGEMVDHRSYNITVQGKECNMLNSNPCITYTMYYWLLGSITSP